MLGEWVFGCDVCQEVCPWNVKFARVADDPALESDHALARLDLRELIAISDVEFERHYGHTALGRAGAAGMRRNARLVAEHADARPSASAQPST